MDRTGLVWMDIILIRFQTIAQWLTLLDADAVDSVGGAVVTAEGDEGVGAAVAERTRIKNGTQTIPNPYRPRILTCRFKGIPLQNLAAL